MKIKNCICGGRAEYNFDMKMPRTFDEHVVGCTSCFLSVVMIASEEPECQPYEVEEIIQLWNRMVSQPEEVVETRESEKQKILKRFKSFLDMSNAPA